MSSLRGQLLSKGLFCCLKRNRHEKLIKKGLKKLEPEIDVVEFLKKFRECKASMRPLPKDQLASVRMPVISETSDDEGQ